MTPKIPTDQKPGAPASFGDFDKFFGHMMRGWPFAWPNLFGGDQRALRTFEHMPNVEVKESEKAYTVPVELPGVEHKDVNVTVENDVLSISGEKKLEHNDDKTHFSERSYGSFTRAFSLPADADRKAISANFAKGVLTLGIPKALGAPAQGKQIEVKAA